ncbi:hypothetical protein R1sor_010717 [Riccia sorocarpa]|uniref:Uncharacterized protein n=1 Tax=Riccia sorocarpa TaxID=122646 RepID=A0ABD3I2W5_9MARC
MARCKQTAGKIPEEVVIVDISETIPLNHSPSSIPQTGKITLRRLDPSDPTFSYYTNRAGSSLTNVDDMAAQRWHLPSDLNIEIEWHHEPVVSWVVDYLKRRHTNLPPEIVLRTKGKNAEGKETKAKEVGVVCFTRPNDSGLEIWYELLKNKHIKKTILPMATLDLDDLASQGKGGLQDIK